MNSYPVVDGICQVSEFIDLNSTYERHRRSHTRHHGRESRRRGSTARKNYGFRYLQPSGHPSVNATSCFQSRAATQGNVIRPIAPAQPIVYTRSANPFNKPISSFDSASLLFKSSFASTADAVDSATMPLDPDDCCESFVAREALLREKFCCEKSLFEGWGMGDARKIGGSLDS